MLKRLLAAAAVALFVMACSGSGATPDGDARRTVTFQRLQLSADFLAEGANVGDFDRDGFRDIVAGPHWYQGPAFSARHAIYPPVVFDRKGYSDNFLAFVHDFDGDQYDDVLAVGFPGQETRWYRNPGAVSAAPGSAPEPGWLRSTVHPTVNNESPLLVDLFGDGAPELVCGVDTRLGWTEASTDPRAPWTFHPITGVGPYQAFTHGLGVGDMNGDGRNDILEAAGWWQQPADVSAVTAIGGWQWHPQPFGAGGGQMFAYDVEGDGDADVITSISAHGYGVSWFERAGSIESPTFIEHPISSAPPDRDALHEPHALALADVDGDGLQDIVTGERFWGHVPAGDPDSSAPARLMWFQLRRSPAGVQFVPHLVDSNSGVGTQVVATDVDGDRRPDIVVASKKGVFLFLQQPGGAP